MLEQKKITMNSKQKGPGQKLIRFTKPNMLEVYILHLLYKILGATASS